MQDVRSSDLSRIAQDLQIRKVQVENVVQLLDEGNTVPFVTRYRKEPTGGLDEELIRKIKKRVDGVRHLSQRKQTILKSIETQGKLTSYLRTAVLKAESDKRLDDLYLPFKPKAATLGSEARERGLGDLADAIWARDPAVSNLEEALPTFINPEKHLHNDIDVLSGVQNILAEKFAETAPVRAAVRGYLWEAAKIKSTKQENAPAAKSSEFKDFFSFSEPLRRIPPHRVLALNRGEIDGILNVTIDCNMDKAHQIALRALADFAHKEALAQQRNRKEESQDTKSASLEAATESPSDPGSVPAEEKIAPVDPSASAPEIDAGIAATGENTVAVATHEAERQSDEHATADFPTEPQDASTTESGESTPPEATADLETAQTETPQPALTVSEAVPTPAAEDESGEPLSPQAPYRTPHAVFLRAVMDDALRRLLIPELEKEIRAELTADAERHAIDVFARNLRSTLLQPPVRNRRVLAIDPTFRGSSQIVVLDEDGNVLDQAMIQPYPPLKKAKKSKQKSEAPKDKKPAMPPDTSQTTVPGATDAPEPQTESITAGASPADSESTPGTTASEASTQTANIPNTEASPSDQSNQDDSKPSNDAPASSNNEPSEPPADDADENPDFNVSGGQPTENEGPSDHLREGDGQDTANATQTTEPEQRETATQVDQHSQENSDGHAQPQSESSTPSEQPVSDLADSTNIGEQTETSPVPAASESGDASSPATSAESDAPQEKEPPRDYRREALTALTELIQKHDIDLVALGNGNGSRDMEELLSDVIAETRPKLEYVLVNEAGVSVYAVSALGRDEMPDESNNVRCAASIGRRLQDPLSELVKIDPQSIGVGLYQHDVNKRELKETLEEVVESCVNYVGVDLNQAHASLLRNVAGLNPMAARELVEYRKKNGPFHNRVQLLQNTGLGEPRFQQAAGFLKVRDGDNPLDRSWIHPECYDAATKLLEELGYTVDAILDDSRRDELRAKLKEITPREVHERLGVGVQTLVDIIDSLCDPDRDVRDEMPPPIFKRGVTKLDDLKPGMKMRGIVLNVVDFGAFVDIGLKDSGLVHISQIANRYIKSPYDVVNVNDVVDVWVLSIDEKRHRVSLSMIEPGAEPAEGKGGRPGKSRPSRPKRRERSEKSKPHKPAEAAEKQAPAESKMETSAPPKTTPEKPPEPPSQSEERDRPPVRQDRPKPRPPRGGRKKRPSPKPKLTKDALEGKVPLRSFGELSVFFSKHEDEPAESEKSESAEEKSSQAEEQPPQDSIPDSPQDQADSASNVRQEGEDKPSSGT